MINTDKYIIQPADCFFASEDDNETTDENEEKVDDEDWNDQGPKDDTVVKIVPKEDIDIPGDDE